MKIRNHFYDFQFHSNSTSSILSLPGASKLFKKLKSFTSMTYEIGIEPLYESLTLIDDNFLNIDLCCDSNVE